jgi:hypothetical protein
VSCLRPQHIRRVERVHGLPLRIVLLDLKYRQGVPVDEIADRLQVPLSTARSWFFREGISPGQLARQKALELIAAEHRVVPA